MPLYKIPQNVEAEDKLLGPFTFKQFLFLIITAIGGLLIWGLWRISPFVALIPLPLVLIFGFLGVYHREDQPVETYLIAALSYYFLKPRKRLWNQEGIRENVRITAPKRKPAPRVRNLEAERGQLERLAQILDTRGLVAKLPELQLPGEELDTSNDDRLVMPQPLSQKTTIDTDIRAEDDILDPNNTTIMQNYSALAEEAAQKVRDQAIEKMRQAITQPAPAMPTELPKILKPKTQDSKLDVQFDPYPSMHQRRMDPKTGKISITGPKGEQTDAVALETINTMTPVSYDAILELSKNNDLKVSQIATQAQRRQEQANQYGTNLQPTSTTTSPGLSG